jgi:hypothetical protein
VYAEEPGGFGGRSLSVTKLVLFALPLFVAAAHVDRGGSSTVTCESAIMVTEPVRPTVERVLFGRVAVPQRDLLQVVRVPGRQPYWRKAGMLVRADSPRVSVSVPAAWRSRVAIEWGDSGVVASLHFAACSTHRWNAYAGGFYVRRPACVPLIVRVARRATQVRFGIGRRCNA